LLQNGPSRVIITSRTVPPNFEGYHLHLGALEPGPAIEFFRQEGLRRNLPPLLEESPEARLVLQSTIEHTGGHPQAMKFVAHRLGTFSLGRIMDDLSRTYQDAAALAQHPAGGLYRYLYRAEWLKLSDPARRLLAAMQDWPGKIEESRLVSLGGPGVDLALDELVAACFVEVRGGFVKNYALHPLTFNLLKTGLTALWEREG
jgi:sorbitol-specific phosphotransferase system component IIC